MWGPPEEEFRALKARIPRDPEVFARGYDRRVATAENGDFEVLETYLSDCNNLAAEAIESGRRRGGELARKAIMQI